MLEFETVLNKGRNIRLHPTGYIQVDLIDGPFEVWAWHSSFSNDLVSIPPVVSFSSMLDFLVERGRVIRSEPQVVPNTNGFYKPIILDKDVAAFGDSRYDIKLTWFDEAHNIDKFGGKFTIPANQACRLFGYLSDHSILVVRKNPDGFVGTRMLAATSVDNIDLSRFQVSPKRLWELLEQVF